MKRPVVVAIAIMVLMGSGYGAFRMARGPSGATAAYGGSVEAPTPPEFASTDTGAWVNGAPTTLASLQGKPVLLEVWSPT
jgi:hypothetical protein